MYKVNVLNDKEIDVLGLHQTFFLCREKNSANKIGENEQVFT